MEPEEQPVALYDFLYKDLSRISSYYSQIFKGKLTAVHSSSLESTENGSSGKAGIHFVEGTLSTNDRLERKKVSVVDPHDVLTTDTLSYLMANKFICQSYDDAHPGQLFIASGSLLFLDKNVLKMANIGLEIASAALPSKQKKGMQGFSSPLKKLLDQLPFESAFLLCDGDIKYGGSIKSEFCEEPISSCYFKHGSDGVGYVHLIGIKESTGSIESQSNETLVGMGQTVAQVIKNFVFPPGVLPATPIALFRSLGA